MRRKNRKIGIIGHFGAEKQFLDGQTVKTKILYEELLLAATSLTDRNIQLCCVDTYYNVINKKKLLRDSLKCILSCDTIILLLSRNGMKIYFPMMYCAKKLLRRKVYHDVIGGNLAEYVRENPKYRKYLNSFDGNWVEFQKMKSELELEGIHNCTVIPNFKRLDVKNVVVELPDEYAHHFCMFSRVMREKGVTEAIKAVAKYNGLHDRHAKLEIWGPVDDLYKEEFEGLLKKHPNDVCYMGKADYDKSVEALTGHVALLFPTCWKGEGFPGTIVDAYSAGVPVIASDWNANSELIENFRTGWVYPNEKVETLYDSISWAMEHTAEMRKMRRACIDKVSDYSADEQIKKLRKMIGI